jgi:hypothetical protein
VSKKENKNLKSLMDEVMAEQAAVEAVDDKISPFGSFEELDPTDEQVDAVLAEAGRIEEFGDRPIAAGAAGIARGASLGLSDVALTKSGLV